MTRLKTTFEACAAEGRAALVGYMTAFDPDMQGSIDRMCAACEAGVDVLEVGVPFSDPSADGPDVQAAMVRALGAGSSLGGVLEVVSAVRARHDTPIVLFSYCNPLLSRPAGVDATMKEAAQAGVDAVLVVDLPPESAAMLRDPARAAGLDWVGLVAPTSHEARRARIRDISTGFVYAVSLTGVTGSALDTSDQGLRTYLAELREGSNLPVCVGFGVRSRDQVRALAPLVDGVVVGSALVRAATEGTETLRALVRDLATGLARS